MKGVKRKMVERIDINVDVGEGFGKYEIPNEAALMPLMTSANIACGYHAGDALTMPKTIALAKKNGVAVGAHPGLPDLLGFGRRVMQLTPEEIYNYIVHQVGALKAFAEIEGIKLHHVKPHGAFLRSTKEYVEQAQAVVQAVLDITPDLPVYCPAPVAHYHPDLAVEAEKRGLKIIPEFYADLNYAPSGVLDQSKNKKLVATPEETAQRVLRFLQSGKVKSTGGTDVEVEAPTICIHGDNPRSLDRLKAIHRLLTEAGIEICPLNG